MPSLHPTAVVTAVLAALLVTSCSSQQDVTAASSASPSAAQPTASAPASTAAMPTPTPTPTPSPAAGATMTITGFEYVLPRSVRPGEQVTVVNEDREAHTVTIDGGAVRLTVLPRATAVFTAPADSGDHPVVCDLHGGMDAVLVVA